MITKLTKEQELQIPKIIQKWVDQASIPMNHKNAIKYTKEMYGSMGEDEPMVVIGDSPLNTCLLASLFLLIFKDGFDKKNFDSQLHSQFGSQLCSQLCSQLNSQLDSQLYSQLRSQLHSQLGSQLYSQLRSQLRSQLHSQLDSQLDSQLRSQLDSQLGSQLRSQLRSQLDSQLDSQLGSQLRSQLGSQLDSQLYSQLDSQLGSVNLDWYLGFFWVVWCGWYEYGRSIGVEFNNDKYNLFINFNSEVNFIIPYKGICFISEKPTSIHWNNGVLHKDGGLAVEYKDGYGMYCLNGVRVPEYLAKTPEGDLSIDFFKKEKNADVKAEFVRKYGMERMKDMGKVIDSHEKYSNYWWTESQYQLVDMSSIFQSIEYAPHLLMKNQTTETWHMEGVSPECRTIEQALTFRCGGKVKITDIR